MRRLRAHGIALYTLNTHFDRIKRLYCQEKSPGRFIPCVENMSNSCRNSLNNGSRHRPNAACSDTEHRFCPIVSVRNLICPSCIALQGARPCTDRMLKKDLWMVVSHVTLHLKWYNNVYLANQHIQGYHCAFTVHPKGAQPYSSLH